MVINDIPHKDGIHHIEDDMYCLRVSSNDSQACDTVYQLYRSVFSNHRWMYKMVGIQGDLDLVYPLFHKRARTIEEKRIGLFSTRLPELYVKISDISDLNKILHYWFSTVYTTQVIYISKPEDTDHLLSCLNGDMSKNCDSISTAWANMEVAIRNQAEAKCDNTFLIFFHKKHISNMEELM